MSELRSKLEAYRSNPSKTVLGSRQMGWLADGVKASVDRGARWQLVGQQTILFDTFFDLDLALSHLREELRGQRQPAAGGAADAKKEHSEGEVGRLKDVLALWEEVLKNVTGWGCGGVFCSGPQKTVKIMDADHGSYGQDVIVTPSVMARMRALYAMGKYRIPGEFDSWQGYTAERRRLLEALLPAAGAAVVYGGDSHNAWAGVVYTESESEIRRANRRGKQSAVCAEIDVTSVTSTGTQNFVPHLPAELLEAAYLAANQARELGNSSGCGDDARCTFKSGMQYARMTGFRG